MRRRALFTAAIALTALLVELGPASRRAMADNTIPDLTMYPDYFGTFLGMSGPGNVEFEIRRQEGRHIWGMITMEFGGLAMPPFYFDGAVTPTPNEAPVLHEFKVRGKGPSGEVMV